MIKKGLIFLMCLFLGTITGCQLSSLWFEGGNTFWKPIDYFPIPVVKIIAMKPFGEEFWVETKENEIYKITYPCSKQKPCWEKSDNIPADLNEGNYVDNKISNNHCENDSFVYPLFHKIKMCITSTTFAADASWKVSLALADNNKLWIWDQPWVSPYPVMASIFASGVTGAIIGIVAGVILSQKVS